MFESVLTQMKVECNDKKLEKNKFEFVYNQPMITYGEETLFSMENSGNGLLKKFMINMFYNW